MQGHRPTLEAIPFLPENLNPFDEVNPFSLLRLAPEALATAIQNLDPKWYRHTERELRALVKPDPKLSRVRLNFWDEYLRACEQQRPMNITAVIKFVCSPTTFYERYARSGSSLAWIITPPTEYMLAMRDNLELVWDKLREVIEKPIAQKTLVTQRGGAPVLDEEGKPMFVEQMDNKHIGNLIKIAAMLDLRVKGAIIQKVQIDQRNLNMNVDANNSPLTATATMEQLEAMEQKIARMKKEMSEVELISAAHEETTEIIDHADIIETEDGSFLREK